MNYITEINAFEQWLETHYLPISSQLLWYKLMSICNGSGWSEWMTVDNLRLMAAMQMGREATLIKARDDLIKAGLVEYQKGRKGCPNKYRIISFTFKSVVQSEVETVVESVVQSEVETVVESVDIYKHKQNKNNNSCSQKSEPERTAQESFALIYAEYPKKVGKNKAYEYYLGWLRGRTVNGERRKLTNKQMYLAVRKYVQEREEEGTELKYYKNFDTFLNKTVLDYLEEEKR